MGVVPALYPNQVRIREVYEMLAAANRSRRPSQPAMVYVLTGGIHLALPLLKALKREPWTLKDLDKVDPVVFESCERMGNDAKVHKMLKDEEEDVHKVDLTIKGKHKELILRFDGDKAQKITDWSLYGTDLKKWHLMRLRSNEDQPYFKLADDFVFPKNPVWNPTLEHIEDTLAGEPVEIDKLIDKIDYLKHSSFKGNNFDQVVYTFKNALRKRGKSRADLQQSQKRINVFIVPQQ